MPTLFVSSGSSFSSHLCLLLILCESQTLNRACFPRQPEAVMRGKSEPFFICNKWLSRVTAVIQINDITAVFQEKKKTKLILSKMGGLCYSIFLRVLAPWGVCCPWELLTLVGRCEAIYVSRLIIPNYSAKWKETVQWLNILRKIHL